MSGGFAVVGDDMSFRVAVRGYLHPEANESEWADVLDAQVTVELEPTLQLGTYRATVPALVTSAGIEWFMLELQELIEGKRQDATLDDFDRLLRLAVAVKPASSTADRFVLECEGRIGSPAGPELRCAERALDVEALRRTVGEARVMLERWPPRFQQFRRPAAKA